MKKLILVFIISCEASFAFSQNDFSIHFAQTFAKFKYTDSKGNADASMGFDVKSSYGINYSKFFGPSFFIKPELGYKNMGALSIFNKKKLEWSLHYLDFNLGAGILKKIRNVHPFGGAAFYISYLYKANQTIGIDFYDLLAMKGIEQMDYGVNLFAGVKYAFTESNSFFFEIRHSTGLHQLEMNSESGQSQKLYNRAVSLHIGVSFYIFKGAIPTRIS